MGRTLQIICGAVLAAGLLGASQQPPQAKSQPSQQNPAPSQGAPVRAAEAESNRQSATNQGGSEEQPSPLERADLAAQQAMALFAGLQLILTFFGLLYIRWTLKETRKAVTEAANATEAAQAAVAVTREAAEKQLRAYVGATSLHMTGVAPGSSPMFHYTLKNTGQTPAKAMRVRLAFRAGARDVPISFPFGKTPQKFDLGAGSETEQTARWHDGANVMPILSEEDFASFVKGEWTFTLAGYVQYQDVFGRTRRTIFRGYAPNHGMTDGKLSMMVARKNVRAT